MNYSDILAQEIIDRFKLESKIKKIWKTRNKIPDKYSNPDYKLPEAPDKSKLILQKRILEILKYEFLNSSLLSKVAGLSRTRMYDAKREKASPFSTDEILVLKKEINRLRLLIIKTFEHRSDSALRDLVKSDMILLRPLILRSGGTNTDYDRASRFRRGEYHLNDSDYFTIKDAYIKIALQLSL